MMFSPSLLSLPRAADWRMIGLRNGFASDRTTQGEIGGGTEVGPERHAMAVTLADIEAARRIIGSQVLRTPMLPAPKLSALSGAQVFVKYENLQVTNSFKERGALVKL